MTTFVTSWLMPAMIALSILLLGRSFYILYVKRCGTLASTIITWLAAAFVVGYWTYRLTCGDCGVANVPDFPSTGGSL